MGLYLYCQHCGAEQKRSHASQQSDPGEHVYFVTGRARDSMLCDGCGKRLPAGSQCHAMTLYTNQTGYRTWEDEFLSDIERPQAGSAPRTVAGVKVYTALIMDDPALGFGLRIVGLPDCEVWASSPEHALERIMEDIDRYHEELERQGTPVPEDDFRVELIKVGSAEFGRRCYDEEDDDYVE